MTGTRPSPSTSVWVLGHARGPAGDASGLVGDASVAAYNTSKASVIASHATSRRRTRAAGCRANCVCPGWIKTGFNDPIFAADPELDENELVAAAVPARPPPG